MSVRKDRNGRWFFGKRVTFQDKSYVDISGYPALNNKVEAAREERVAIQRALDDFYNLPAQTKEVPTFDESFNGKYMSDWCVVNKKGTVEEKVGAYNFRIKKVFGHLRLDEIGTPEIDAFRAGLLSEKKLGKKHINNLLVIISKPLAVRGGLRDHLLSAEGRPPEARAAPDRCLGVG